MNQQDDGGVVCPSENNSCLPEGVLRPGGLKLTEQLIGTCAFLTGGKVVDVGCGTGITVEYLRDKYGFWGAGVDISATRIQQGKARTAGLRLIQAAGETLPFAGNSVDGVLAECSLSVMQDTGRVLSEIWRILKPGGKLGVTDLYFRQTSGGVPPGATTKTGIMNHDELMEILEEKGFKRIVWDDRSACLNEFVARFIMEHGSAEMLWQCLALRQKDRELSQQTLKRGLGYFLLVAEKPCI